MVRSIGNYLIDKEELSSFISRMRSNGRVITRHNENPGSVLLKPFYDLPAMKDRVVNKANRILEIIKE